MLLTFSIAVLITAAPQGRVVVVTELESEGVASIHLATVRDAIVTELKEQGYDARAAELGTTEGSGVISGAVMVVGGTYAVVLKLREAGANQILAAATVRCGSSKKLGEAAKEAASQLVREGREKWGVRARFKPAAK